MCGIYSLIISEAYKKSPNTHKHIKNALTSLIKTANERGRDASGISIYSKSINFIYKSPFSGKRLLSNKEVLFNIESTLNDEGVSIILGHGRLVTNGSKYDYVNNQPIITDNQTLISNGILLNDSALTKKFHLNPAGQNDAEVIALLVDYFKVSKSLDYDGMSNLIGYMSGVINFISYDNDSKVVTIFTNNGSLYYHANQDFVVIASELIFVKNALNSFNQVDSNDVTHLSRNQIIGFNLDSRSIKFGKKKSIIKSTESVIPENFTVNIAKYSGGKIEYELNKSLEISKSLRRCTRCILTETFPGIKFDYYGVCSECNNQAPISYRGDEYFYNHLSSLSNKRVLVPFSGGRDSSYVIAKLKKDTDLDIVAYTYDWGFVTDIARRNISRVCGDFGIEHILVSANLDKKRSYVRKNVLAWLNKPSLAMVPLFTAGDKEFFYHASRLVKTYGFAETIFSMNWLERTGFKAGFAGVHDRSNSGKTHSLSLLNRVNLGSKYLKELVRNPSYLNSSLLDNVNGFRHFYFSKMDFIQYFDYFKWDESEVNSLLTSMNWEFMPGVSSSWRIGDATAPFYNHIYQSFVGFSESDTFRSNQIRNKMITREESLKSWNDDNNTRVDGFIDYCNLLGLEPLFVAKKIRTYGEIYRSSTI